jgi:hypothetical protein
MENIPPRDFKRDMAVYSRGILEINAFAITGRYTGAVSRGYDA